MQTKRKRQIITESQEFIDEITNKNAELQKKVDELAYELAKKSIATEGINVTNTDISLCVHEKLLEQAVKDAATEIFAELFYMASIHHSDVANILAWAKEKAKSKGVEVE